MLVKNKVNKQNIIVFLMWAYICFNSMLLFRTNATKNIMTLSAILGLLFFTRKFLFPSYAKTLLLTYGLLIGTTILGAISCRDISGIFQSVKVLTHFLVLIIILCGLKPSNRLIEKCMSIYLFIAVFTSIQCLMLFVIVWFDLMDSSKVFYEAYGLNKVSYGIFGFGDAINYFSSSAFLRTSGFFREPSKLGAFLIAPMFWTIAKYKETKRKRYMLYEIIITLNFLATFSRAAWLALVVCIGCLMVFKTAADKKRYHVTTFKMTIATFIALGCVVLFFVSGHVLYNYSQSVDEMYANITAYEGNALAGMINRSSTLTSKYNNAFIRDDSSFAIIFERLKTNLFGYGLGWSNGEIDFNNPTGLGFWVYSGGVIALLLLCALYTILFYRYFLGCMYSADNKLKAIGLAFMGVTVQNMSYGSWEEPYYLFIIGLMVVSVELKKVD